MAQLVELLESVNKGMFPNKPWNSRKIDFNESSK